MAKKSKSNLKKGMTFSTNQVMLFILAFAAVGAVAIWQSLAAPHNSHGGGGSLSLVMVTDNNSNGSPNLGDTVTFNVSTASVFPYVTVSCKQNNVQVFSQTAGFFSSFPLTKNFQLGPTSLWTNGAADCTANMFTSDGAKQTALATTIFTVNP